jgi:hypothetical protein
MKNILVIAAALVCINSQAKFVGEINHNNAEVTFGILSHTGTNNIGFSAKILEGEGEANERSTLSRIPLDVYKKLTNSSLDVEEVSEEVEFRATGSKNNRTIEIIDKHHNDGGRLVLKTVTTLNLKGSKASLNIKDYVAKGFIINRGMKLRAENQVDNISFSRKGICLYDISGYTLGKVLTTKALNKAASDTSERALKEVSEEKCDY